MSSHVTRRVPFRREKAFTQFDLFCIQTVLCVHAAVDCGAVLQQLLSTAKCAAKAQPTFDNAPKAAGGNCAAAQAAIGEFDPDCCAGLREMTTSVSLLQSKRGQRSEIFTVGPGNPVGLTCVLVHQ